MTNKITNETLSPQCFEHSGVCERIVAVEEKVGEVRHKQEKFFWWLFCCLATSVVTLLIALVNMVMNEKMLQIANTLAKVSGK